MLNELSKGGTKASDTLKEETGKSFQELMGEGKSLSDVLLILQDSAKKNGKALNDVFGSSEAAKAAMTLLAGEGEEFNKVLKDMNNSAGATNKAFEQVSDTSKERMVKAINEFKNSLLKLGEAATPILEEVTELIGKVTDYLGGLSDEQLASLVNFTKWGLIVGGTGKVVGGTLETVGSLTGGMSKLAGMFGKASGAAASTSGAVASTTGALSGFGGALAAGASAAAPFILGATAAAGAVALVAYNVNQDVVPAVDLFATKLEYAANGATTGAVTISEATKEAVNSYLEMDREVASSLLNFKVNNTEITEDIAVDLTTQFNDMGKTITTELDKDLANNLKVMQEFFTSGSNLTSEEQASMLVQLQNHYKNEKQTTEQSLIDINNIIQQASNEKRALTEQEQEQIATIRENMTTTAINCLSEQEQESQIIVDRMKGYNTRVTAELVGEQIALLEESRVQSVDKANQEYQERVEVAELLRQEGGEEAEALADKMIEEAERQRDETIASANAIKEQGLDELSKSYEDLRTDIDLRTGEILSFWQRMSNWWDSWIPKQKIFEVDTNVIPAQRPVNEGNNRSNYGSGRSASSYSMPDMRAMQPSMSALRSVAAPQPMIVETMDYNKFQSMFNQLAKDISISNNNAISISAREISDKTFNFTDREIARQVSIKSYGFE